MDATLTFDRKTGKVRGTKSRETEKKIRRVAMFTNGVDPDVKKKKTI